MTTLDTVRPETDGDLVAVRRVNERAFLSATEADLVDALRQQASPFISLVAIERAEVVGHISFSPVTLEGVDSFEGMGLAPMAVLPDFQKRGVGSQLVHAGLNACRALGRFVVVVVGHPDYYPRFGFAPASRWRLTCEYPVPDEVFMALELEPGALQGRSGLVRYHAAFANL